jgi:tRNA dimethylallyltransferase
MPVQETPTIQRPTSNIECVYIAGPTAVGKSAVAMAMAARVGGEIISVDSMQVYRGLDVGTAKPTPAERARVPHHGIDVCDLREAFDAAQFVRLARDAAGEIQSRGRTPILCGGTGLYFQAFLGGLGEAPPIDEKLRAELEAAPPETLLDELSERDPATFASIDRKNPRRVIRAVEVIRLTGRKFSEQRAAWESGPAPGRDPSRITHHASRIYCLIRAQDDLRERINRRVDEMFSRGLVEETRGLLNRGLAENRIAMQAIGYRQVVEHLRGERGLAETIELVKSRTRQFARRQLTWFRRHGPCDWVEIKRNETAEETLAKIGSGLFLDQLPPGAA